MDKKVTSNNKGMGAILQGVDLLVNDKIKHSQFDKTLAGIVTYADYETNTYSVKINEYVYKNIPSSIKANVNDSVLLTCPQNQISQMFINGKIDTTDYTMIDDVPIYNDSGTNEIKVMGDVKFILKGYADVALHLESGKTYMLYSVAYDDRYLNVAYHASYIIYTSLIDSDVAGTPIKLNGTSTVPYLMNEYSYQTLVIHQNNPQFIIHFALKQIF